MKQVEYEGEVLDSACGRRCPLPPPLSTAGVVSAKSMSSCVINSNFLVQAKCQLVLEADGVQM